MDKPYFVGVFLYFTNQLMKGKKSKISNEELANVFTHGLGLLLSLIFVPILIRNGWPHHTALVISGLWIFGLSIFLVYLSSTIYHLVQQQRLKFLLRKIDHISIYFLIAGTHTPFLLLYSLEDGARFYMILLWSMVLIGVIYKIFFFGKLPLFSILFYLLLGWMAVLTIPPMLDQMSNSTFYWIIAGGVFYTGGILFYLWEKLPFNHAIWHMFVLFGTTGHYMAVWDAVI